MKTAEGVLRKYVTIHTFGDINAAKVSVIQAMEEYAAQFKQEIRFPSEEERIKEQSEYLTDEEERAFYAGQKWMKSWIKENNK